MKVRPLERTPAAAAAVPRVVQALTWLVVAALVLLGFASRWWRVRGTSSPAVARVP